MKRVFYLLVTVSVFSCQQEPVGLSKIDLDKSALKKALEANADFNNLSDAWDSYIQSLGNNSVRISPDQKHQLDLLFAKINGSNNSISFEDKEIINSLILKNADNRYFELKKSVYNQLFKKYNFSMEDFNLLAIEKTKQSSANAKEAPGSGEDCIKVMEAMYSFSWQACLKNSIEIKRQGTKALIVEGDRCNDEAEQDAKIAYIGCVWGQIGIRN
ncbi:MAG: hypothetical protein U0U09_05015 [Cyclobacteriaceae bacterium]